MALNNSYWQFIQLFKHTKLMLSLWIDIHGKYNMQNVKKKIHEENSKLNHIFLSKKYPTFFNHKIIDRMHFSVFLEIHFFKTVQNLILKTFSGAKNKNLSIFKNEFCKKPPLAEAFKSSRSCIDLTNMNCKKMKPILAI